MAYYYYDFTNGNDSRSGLRIPAGDHNSTSYNTIDSTADTTHFVDSALTGLDDYINGSFVYNVTRSAGALITDFDAATDTVTLGTAIAGMSAGDSYYILDARKTILDYATNAVAGDIVYVRANMTDTQGAADITLASSGTATSWIKVIGCNATQGIDPWHDASDTRPTIDFNDGAYQLYSSSKGYWEFRNLIIQDSFDTSGLTYFAGTASSVFVFYNCYFLNDNNTGRYLFYANYGAFTFDSCQFKGGGSSYYNLYLNSVKIDIMDCTFNAGTSYATYGAILFQFGCELNIFDSTFGATTAYSTRVFYMQDFNSMLRLQNCTFDDTKVIFSSDRVGGSVLSEDTQQSYGAHKAYYTTGTVTKDTSVKRTGGADSSAKIVPSSVCNAYRPITVTGYGKPYDFAVWCPAEETTLTIYIRSYGTWSSTYPTATELYVEASYLDHGTNATRSKAVSTDVLTDETTWVSFDVTVTPLQAGFVYLTVFLKKYTASSGCYVDILPVIT